jgi:hypothetical protein
MLAILVAVVVLLCVDLVANDGQKKPIAAFTEMGYWFFNALQTSQPPSPGKVTTTSSVC